MENWNYNHIPDKSLIITLVALTLPLLSSSQDLQRINLVRIKEPVAVSMDRNGSILMADKWGNINRISKNGDMELNYSPEKNGRVTLLEGWTTLDILVFYESFQSVTLLDRFLAPISSIDLAPHVGFGRLATYNYESNIWVIDDTDFSLKLLDTSLNKITINTPFNLILDPDNYEIAFAREYQNLLFISDLKTGILIFDNLGNYLKTLPVKEVTYFGFVDNDIYFVSGSELIFQDIYSTKEKRIEVPTAKYYLASNNRLFLFSKDWLTIYNY